MLLMTQEKVAQYFDALSSTSHELSQEIDVSYVDALIEVIDDINAGDVHRELGRPSQSVAEKIEQAIHLNWSQASDTDKRKAVQLAILQANRDDRTPANYQITPDGIGYLLASLISQTASLVDDDTIIDITVGSGNLLWTVSENLDFRLNKIGIDNDETQLALAAAGDELINPNAPTTFYQADILSLDETPKAKVVIADVPVGYYSVDDANQFETQSSNGQAWVQNLIVEKSLSFVSDDGWVYLIVPAALLSGDNAKQLLQFVTSHTQLKAFLQLPNDFFQDERAAKAILVLKKKSDQTQKEVLMGQYPSLKNPKKLQEFLQDIEAWVKLDKEV